MATLKTAGAQQTGFNKKKVGHDVCRGETVPACFVKAAFFRMPCSLHRVFHATTSTVAPCGCWALGGTQSTQGVHKPPGQNGCSDESDGCIDAGLSTQRLCACSCHQVGSVWQHERAYPRARASKRQLTQEWCTYWSDR